MSRAGLGGGLGGAWRSRLVAEPLTSIEPSRCWLERQLGVSSYFFSASELDRRLLRDSRPSVTPSGFRGRVSGYVIGSHAHLFFSSFWEMRKFHLRDD